MRNLNGFRQLNGLKLAFATALLVTFIGGTANADLILDNVRVITNINGIVISPTTGDIMISTVTQDYVVTQSGTVPDTSVAITRFSATSPILTGGSITIDWSTRNATSCAAGGNLGSWSGSVLTNGSVSVEISSAGVYNLTLTCQGDSGPVSDSTPVTVNEPAPSPSNCTAPSLSNTAVPQQWDSFWGAAFPQTATPIKRLDIGRSGYNYISFNTGDANGNGAALLIETTTSPDGRIGSVSACPGDFEVANVCKGRWGVNDWIAYSTNGTAGTCQLSKNTTYYLNFTFTDGKNASTSTCASSRCLVEIQVAFRAQ